MHRKLSISLSVGVTFSLALVLAIMASAQQQGPAEGKTTEQAFANIKVLQGMPAEQLLPTMTVWATSLGVGCPLCHTPPNFASDEKAPKQTARQMFILTQSLNKTSFDGRNTVTCYTCHHGTAIPGAGPTAPAGPGGALSTDVLPTADEIVANYVAAIGGEQSVHKMTTLYVSETREIQGRLPAQFERFRKAPDLDVTVMKTPIGIVAQGFDGKTAWTEDGPASVGRAAGTESARARAESDFYSDFDLKKAYPALILHGIEKLNGRNLYRLDGFAGDGSPIQLYFDAQTGLLSRKVSSAWLALGEGAITTDFDDYRDVDGVKFPFMIREVGPKPNQRSEIHVDELKINVPIDGSKFVMPTPTPGTSWTLPSNR